MLALGIAHLLVGVHMFEDATPNIPSPHPPPPLSCICHQRQQLLHGA